MLREGILKQKKPPFPVEAGNGGTYRQRRHFFCCVGPKLEAVTDVMSLGLGR